ncbi:unnamed protein product, partial [Heterosigma akashiwo]
MRNRLRVNNLLGKHKLPLTMNGPISKVMQQSGVDMGNIKSWNGYFGARNLAALNAKYLLEKQQQRRQSSRFIAISSDGSVGNAHTANETVRIRAVVEDESGQKELDEVLAGVAKLHREDASGTLRGIKEKLKQAGYDLDDNTLLQLLEDDRALLPFVIVCANFDGASVNMGVNQSVAKLLKDLFPWLVITHCVCHNLELAILDLKKEHEYLQHFDGIMKQVYKFYHYSSKRREEFKTLCAIEEQAYKEFGGIQSIRWAASVSRALVALHQNWKVTVAHLDHVSNEGDADVGAWAVGLRTDLTSKRFILHLHFMLDLMQILGVLSKTFQDPNITILDVFDKVTHTKRQLEAMKECRPSRKRKSMADGFNDPTTEIDAEILQAPQAEEPAVVASEMDTYFKALVEDSINFIESRYAAYSKAPLVYFKVFDFKKWPAAGPPSTYGDQSIQSILDHFKRVLPVGLRAAALTEWPALKRRVLEKRHTEVGGKIQLDSYLSVYIQLINESPHDVQNILGLVELLLVLSPATAGCERSFSNLKLIQNKTRTKLLQEVLNNLMIVTEQGATVEQFDPDPVIDLWVKLS